MTIDDFQKIELRVGKIISAAAVAGSSKLLVFRVDFGEKDGEGNPKLRQIFSGIAKGYQPEALVNQQVIGITNLEPRLIMGGESQGMLLAATDESGVVSLLGTDPNCPVAPGSKVS